MADQSHLEILRQGAEAWNSWRARNPAARPSLSGATLLGSPELFGANLSGADLRRAYLSKANLREADFSEADLSGANLKAAELTGAFLSEANLSEANLKEADLQWADLSGADLTEANLSGADLTEANLTEANLTEAHLKDADLQQAELARTDLSGAQLFGAQLFGANLTEANLREADLRGADLSSANLTKADLAGTDLTHSSLVKTNLTGTMLTGCRIYGISAWSLKLESTKQQDLNVSDYGEPAVMVDNLEVAQFVYLLLNNEKIRDVLNTIGEKGVLILGRFTEERMLVLDAIRDRLRELGFVPMMFDFERPTQQDFDETIKTLAGLSRFIIADITNPKSSPLELQAIMPNYMVPFVPIIQEDEEPFSMFQGLQHKSREWVLDVLEYDSADNLLEVLDEAVVRPALDKSNQLVLKKAEAIRTRHIRDYQ
jgi:uncharacterized protein YjbI with pentapeptide repeats